MSADVMANPDGEDIATHAQLLRRRLESRALDLPVAGESMGSTIKAGSTVRVVGRDNARPGEIWAFLAPESKIVVHRIRHVDAELFTGRGDGNARDDHTMPVELLVGRVLTSTSPSGRRRRFGDLDRLAAHLRLTARRLLRPLVRRNR